MKSKHHYLLRGIGLAFLVLIGFSIMFDSHESAIITLTIIISLIIGGIVLDVVFIYPVYVAKEEEEALKSWNKQQDMNKKKNIIASRNEMFKNKYSMPSNADIIKCSDLDTYSEDNFKNIQLKVWKHDKQLILIDNDGYNFKGEFEIPIDKIKSFQRFGDITSYTKIKGGGGGGSSVGGAIVGGIIAGEAGAVIGSRKKSEEIKSEHIVEDERKTILEVQGNERMHYLVFGSKDYDAFLKLIPQKEKNYVDANKSINIVKEETSKVEINSSNEKIYRDIELLFKLKESGILTEEEFNEKKKLLLDKIVS